MKIAIVTGSAGLVGSEAVRLLAPRFDLIVGIDNEMRQVFFGQSASVTENREDVERIPNYHHHRVDIRDYDAVSGVFRRYSQDIELVIHTAGQPSHEWATEQTLADFDINAVGTLNLLEATRRHCFDAVFIYTSTNMVYGDVPNALPLVELVSRWDVDPNHPFHQYGIDESMTVDHTNHTFFGVSKLSADLMAQEYGRHLGMKVGVFRCSCLTGPRHAGVELHGYLSHLVRSAVSGSKYTIIGHKGKQVRDNLDARDLAQMFWHFYQNPRSGVVYHAGGGRDRSCSVLETISRCEELTGRPMELEYVDQSRFADARWWISDTRKFEAHYPAWKPSYTLDDTLVSMYDHWTLTSTLESERIATHG